MLGIALLTASCTEDYTDWASPQVFPEEEAKTVTVATAAAADVDFATAEVFWAEQVREYFRNQPFILTADTSKTIGANLDELFEQAKKRLRKEFDAIMGRTQTLLGL